MELSLLSSYLNNREQMVVQGQDKSGFKSVVSGVPQGSVLGPFLFVVSVNDFSFSMPCDTVLYADDTTLINYSPDFEKLILKENRAMDKALEWFQANSLKVNDSKTENLIFTLNNSYNNAKDVKLLGIVLDSQLSWDGHIEHLCIKLARVTYLIRKLRSCVSEEMLLTTYYAFFHSHLRYGVVLWGNSSHSKKAFIWQKKVLRCIKNVHDRESCKPIFKDLQIMTLPCLYIYCCLLSVKESINNFTCRENVHSHFTRRRYMLDQPAVRLSKSKTSFICMKIQLFNKLPERAWVVEINNFKTVLSKWLKEMVFYTVEDFLTCDVSSLIF
jgi:hypothetical protein